jgi:RHS repeat-associated protein
MGGNTKVEDKKASKAGKTKNKGPHKAAQPLPWMPKPGSKAEKKLKKKIKKLIKKAKKAAGTKKAKKPKKDPIDVVTGAVVGTIECFALRGVLSTRFTLTYDSQRDVAESPFGRSGWMHTFHRWIEPLEIEDAPPQWFMLDDEGDWRNLGELPRDEAVWLRAGRMEVHRRELTAEVRVPSERRTYVFERAATDEPYRLRAIVDPRGNRIRVEWDGAQVSRVVHTSGRELRFSLDAKRRIVRAGVWLEDRELQFVDFEYSDAGELAAVKDALGFAFRYEYDGQHRVVQKTLPNGFRYHYKYDESDRCIRAYGDGGVLTADFLYNDAKREVVVTGGDATVYVLDEQSNVVEQRTIDGQSSKKYAFDDDGFLVSGTNGEGETTLVEYDELGNVSKMTDPAGNETVLEYEGELLKSKKDPGGVVYTYTHDRFGALLELRASTGAMIGFEYDEYGRIVGVLDERGPREQRTYDERHDRTSTKNRRGGLWRFEHDGMGRLVAETDPRGHTTRFVRDALGQTIERVTPDGARYRTEYGPLGLAVKRFDPLGRQSSLEYGRTGVLVRRVSEDGGEWNYAYDMQERLTRVVNPKGETYAFAYDRASRVEREETFDGRVIRYTYDKANRQRRVIQPDETFREYTYDALGNVVVESSSHGARIFERNQVGAVMKATVEDGPEEIVVTFVRDAFGRVVREEHGPIALDLKHDPRGRVVERRVLDETTRYAYDESGSLQRVEHEGRALSFARDVGGYEVRRMWQEQAAVDSSFDGRARLADRRVIGPRAGDAPSPSADAAHALGGLPPGYEAWRILSHRRWAHDAADQVESITDWAWGRIGYRYDRLSHLLSAGCGSWRETFDYDAAGSVVQALELRDGVPVPRKRTSFSPTEDTPAEPAGPTNAAPQPWVVARGNVLLQDDRFAYEVDDGNRRRVRTDLQTGERTEYVWDARQQLREVRRPDGIRVRFFYDAFGRRVRKEIWTPPKRDLATALGKGEAVVDPATAAKDAEPTCQATYYAWHEQELVGELGPGGRRVHVHRPTTLVPLLQSEQGRVFLVVTDKLGTPKELVDERGSLAWSAFHGAWGNVREAWRPGSKALDVRSPFRLLGQFYDDDAGLALTRFRAWDAETARWLSPDPLGLLGGTNLFGYEANPTGWVDPYGLENTNKTQGDAGEADAGFTLQEEGFTVLGSMQNSSGHGVDLVVVGPNGEVQVMEVKTNGSRLNPDQEQGADYFAATRAERALEEWGSPEGNAELLAELIQETRRSGPIEGEVLYMKENADGEWYVAEREDWVATTAG